jgi:hypothetical protein
MKLSMEASTMLAKSRAYIGFVVSFLLLAGASFAQISAVEGDVKGTDGQPIKGAEILIERKDMKGTYKGAKSDKKGHYIYNGLPLGTYKVSVLVGGEVKDSVDGVRTKLGDPTDVSFDLRKTSAQAGPGAGPAAPEQERGMTKEQKEARDKAKAQQEAAIQKNKALNDAFNAGKEAMLAKNYDAAADAFKKATEIDPSQHVIWASLGEAYINMSAAKTGAEQQAALDQGLQAYAKAIELKADDPGYHNNYALALAKSKKFTEAQAELQKAAQMDPQNAAKYYYNLAVPVRDGAVGQAFDCRRWQSDGAPGHAGSAREIPVAKAGRPVCRSGQGDVADDRRNHSDQLRESERAEEESSAQEVERIPHRLGTERRETRRQGEVR